MVPNQLLLKLTSVCIGVCHILSLFLELSFLEGVKHFLGLLNQPPTPLITLVLNENLLIHSPTEVEHKNGTHVVPLLDAPPPSNKPFCSCSPTPPCRFPHFAD